MSRKLISPAFETGQQRTITPPAFEAGQKKRINPDAGNVFVCDVKSAVETQTVKIKGAQSVGDGAVLVEIPIEITARVMVFNRIGGRMTELGRIIGVLRNDRVFTFQYERMLELMGLTGEVRTRSRTPGIYIEDHDISIPLSRHRTLGRHEARIRDIVDTVREATGFEITHFRRASDGVFDVHIVRERILDKVIYIDPGHGINARGGFDPGATWESHHEAYYVLQISQSLKRILESFGATVHIGATFYDPVKRRSDAIPLGDRPRIINELAPDLAISIHLNAHQNVSANGAEVLYRDRHPQNRIIGEFILDSLVENTPFVRRQVYQLPGAIGILENTLVPIVLVETGFISNENDRNYIINNTEEIARAIATGVVNYFRSLEQ